MSAPTLDRPRPVYAAGDLLAAYLPGSFYYSSQRSCLLGDGVHAVVQAQPADRAAAAAEALAAAIDAGLDDPVVSGAIGFHPDAAASLFVPAVVRRAAPSRAIAAPRWTPAPQRWTRTPRPEPQRYVDGVRQALELIDAGEMSKVVLARCLELTAADEVAVQPLLARLVGANPGAHAFAVDVTAPGDSATWTLVGASPELLVSRKGTTVTANPLAGSVPRVADEADDAARAAELLSSEKDLREHSHVAEQVGDVLAPYCARLKMPAQPEVIATPTMWHLSSRISGVLKDPDDAASSSLALAEALHPTPAVGGVPVERAQAAIRDIEPENRGYFSGLVGWMGAGGDGEWAVTIRSAEVSERTVRLHAGAGIVAGSDPQAELAETSAKLRTMLHALGIEDAA